METITQQQNIWSRSMNFIKDGFLTEIPEWMYDDMLNNMPPILMNGGGYVNSEPYSYNNKEQSEIYFCGIESGNKFYGCHATVNQFKSREPLKRGKKMLNDKN